MKNFILPIITTFIASLIFYWFEYIIGEQKAKRKKKEEVKNKEKRSKDVWFGW